MTVTPIVFSTCVALSIATLSSAQTAGGGGGGGWVKAIDSSTSAAGVTTAPVDLRPKWEVVKPGSSALEVGGADARYVFTLENIQTSTPPAPPATAQTPDPQAQTTTTRQTIEFVRRAVPTPPGGEEGVALALLIRYERVKVHISVGSNPTDAIDIDTALPPEKDGDRDLGDSVRNTVAKPFTLLFDKEGRLIRVEGNKFTRGNIPSAQSIAGDEVFRTYFAPLFALHGDPGRVGGGTAINASWPASIRVVAGHMGTIVTDLRGTLDSVEGSPPNLAKVSFKGTPSIAPAIGPMSMRAESTGGSFQATADWDVRAGRLRSYSSLRTLDYTIEAQGGKTAVRTKLTTSLTEAPPKESKKTP